MGLIVVPFGVDGGNRGERSTYKKTLEVNFAPCSIMAYATLARLIPRGDYGSGGVGIKRVRRRRTDGSDETLTLGNGEDNWPTAWCGDRITSVTFAAYVYDESSLNAVCVIHTW